MLAQNQPVQKMILKNDRLLLCLNAAELDLRDLTFTVNDWFQRAGDRDRTGDVQLGKLNRDWYHTAMASMAFTRVYKITPIFENQHTDYP